MANYSVGDTVGVRIHKVDRTNTSKKLLPRKILEETSTRDRFRVYSKDGILATTFAHTDLIDFRNVKFDDLVRDNRRDKTETDSPHKGIEGSGGVHQPKDNFS